MDYKEIIKKYENEAIETLRKLVQIPSVLGESKTDAPFGTQIAEAFHYMLNLGEAAGFDVKNIDNIAGHIDFKGSSEKILGIPVHLDVVPANEEGWTDDPFSGKIKDNILYGRGTTDNKNAVIAIFYALKALKEAEFMPKDTVRVILGLDEETGWEGIYKYLETVGTPNYGFAPDADFPVINGEKGILTFNLAMKLEGANVSFEDGSFEILRLSGGQAPNMVADHARVVLKSNNLRLKTASLNRKNAKKAKVDITQYYLNILHYIDKYKKETGMDISGSVRGKNIEIIAKGISAHGSTPEKGLNAIAILMDFLKGVSISSDRTTEFIRFFNEAISFETDGASLDINFEDDVSGKLILNVGQIIMDKSAILLTLNIRYPITISSDEIFLKIEQQLTNTQMGIVRGSEQLPIYSEVDSEFIQTLTSVYSECTGDTKSKPFTIGGGTFARIIPNAVAYGPRFPHNDETMHQRNEHLNLDDFIKSIYIYAEAIKRLSEQKNI
jgi:succinyl-diaminopimelate desuccinylase